MPADLARDGTARLAGRADWLLVVNLTVLEPCGGEPIELRVGQRLARGAGRPLRRVGSCQALESGSR